MKTSIYTEAQILAILRQAEGGVVKSPSNGSAGVACMPTKWTDGCGEGRAPPSPDCGAACGAGRCAKVKTKKNQYDGLVLWCGWSDSNRHSLRKQSLSLSRLPFRHTRILHRLRGRAGSKPRPRTVFL